MITDEVWVIGGISDGVMAEISLAEKLNKRIKYFSTANSPRKLKEVKKGDLKLEK